MTDFATLVLGAQTAGLKAGEQALDDIAAKGEQTEARTEAAARGMGEAYEDAGRRIGRSAARIEGSARSITRGFRMQAGGGRMLTQQLSQVGQMYTATGNAGQALAVQAADIGMLFGAIGTAIGTVAGIALPALIAKFGDGKDSAERYADALEGLEDAYGNLSDAADIAISDLDDLKEKYGENAEAVRELYRELIAVEQAYAMGSLREVVREQEASLDGLRESLQAFSDARVAFATAQQAESEGHLVSVDTMLRLQGAVERAQAAIQEEYGLTTAQAYRLKDALDAVQSAGTGQEAAEAARRLSLAIASAANEGAKLPPEMANLAREAAGVYSTFVQMETKADDVHGSINFATDALRKLLGMGAGDSWLDGMISSAGRLANTIWGAVNAMAALRNAEGLDAAGNETEFGPGSRARRPPKKPPSGEGGVDWGVPKTTGGGGGGGAGAANTLANDLEGLREELRSRTEVIQEWYEENNEILISAREQQLLTETEYMEQRERLEAEHQARLTEERRQANEAEVSMREKTVDLLGGLLGTLGRKSSVAAKAAVALNAAKAISETIQNTAAASVRALAELGPIAGAAAAARIKMYGAAQVGIIAANAALNIGGGGGGSGGAGVSASASGGTTQAEPAAPTQTWNFTIQNDPFGIGENVIRQIAEQMNEATRNGMVVTVTT